MNGAQTGKGRVWQRFVGESLAILIGILLAFSIDAWWAARSDRAEEQSALGRLRDEFSENREQLHQIQAGHRRVLGAAVRLLELSASGAESAEQPELDSLIWELRDWWSYNPASGSLNSLISSGRLALIRSDSLRTELAAWPDYVEDLNEDERIAVAEVHERLIPYLSGRIALRHLDPSSRVLPRRRSSNDYRSLLADRRFENLLVVRRTGTTFIVLEADRVDAKLERIVSLIDEELAPSGN